MSSLRADEFLVKTSKHLCAGQDWFCESRTGAGFEDSKGYAVVILKMLVSRSAFLVAMVVSARRLVVLFPLGRKILPY